MLLSAKPILLSDTPYSETSTTHVIIKHMMLLSEPYVVLKQIMLLSNNSCYDQTPHIIINTSTYYSYTSYRAIIIMWRSPHFRGATGRALAYHA